MQTILDAAADPRQGRVVIHVPEGSGFRNQHERETRHWVAEQVARLKGYAFQPDAGAGASAGTYFLPTTTLLLPQALDLAITAIVHPLVGPDAARPEGWSNAFPATVQDVVLKGYTAFSKADAVHAACRMLADGPVRLKAVEETGGRGQVVVESESALPEALSHFPDHVIGTAGLVVEENLIDVVTFSVGQVRFGDTVVSYHGTQTLTRNNTGGSAYGGSALAVSRGGFEKLLDHAPTPELHTAISQAMRFDAAADRCFPGLLVSRRNYDVAYGTGADGTHRAGLLEQSWRIGGATPAELMALSVLQAEPERDTVHAVCVETYRADPPVPPNAVVTFSGNDPDVGPLTKYVYADPA
jgi:hypothetical protein